MDRTGSLTSLCLLQLPEPQVTPAQPTALSLALSSPYMDMGHCIKGHPTQGDPIFTSDIS